MLNLDDVSLYRGSKLLFEHATLQLYRGQRVGVVGVNGSGKSSLFALIQGELSADHGALDMPSGLQLAQVSQHSPDSDSTALDFVLDGDSELRGLQGELAVLEQEPSPGPNPDRLHEVHERLELIGGYAAEARAARLLSGLGFEQQQHALPVRTFSGGWRMRLALAQVLMCRSDILLLDEPTNHLDLPAILWLERWLQKYEGLLLVILHDRDFLDAVCTHVVHIESQALTLYTGNYRAFERIRAEQLAHQQSMHEKQNKEIAHLQAYIDRFRYKASKARQAQSRIKTLERMTRIAPAHVDGPFHFSFLEPERQPQHVLQLEEVSAGYQREVVGGVNLGIRAGSRMGLLGANGAGKSTLLKALVDGSTVLSGKRTVHPHARIGYFAQHQLELLEMEQSPLWHVQQAAPGETEQSLRNHLGKFGFQGDRVVEPVAPFSGGEKARLVLAMLILQRPNLLLLDEPTNHLDLEMRHALSMALLDYGGALLVISHDRHLLRTVCDELWLVHAGRVFEFEDELDAYPAWLDRQREPAAAAASARAPQPSRKSLRQADAERRQRLAPLRQRALALEQAMARTRTELEQTEKRLAALDLYTDPTRKADLTRLVEEQGQMRNRLELLESEWLDFAEKLEAAAATGNSP